MPEPPVTSLSVAGFSVALIALSIPVTLRRIKVDAPIGNSNDETLTRRIRAQGNFIEYVPLALLSLGLLEFTGAQLWTIVAIGGMLALGRGLHAAGTLEGSTPLRGIGMIFTYLALLAAAVCLAAHYLV